SPAVVVLVEAFINKIIAVVVDSIADFFCTRVYGGVVVVAITCNGYMIQRLDTCINECSGIAIAVPVFIQVPRKADCLYACIIGLAIGYVWGCCKRKGCRI